MDSMKIASLWKREGEVSKLKADLGRCEDPELKARLLGFLGGGGLVLHAPGLRPDRLDPPRADSVPLGYVTDGSWIWPLELAYYLGEHDVLPPRELLDHARSQEYLARDPTPAELAAASRLLSGGSGGLTESPAGR